MSPEGQDAWESIEWHPIPDILDFPFNPIQKKLNLYSTVFFVLLKHGQPLSL
jgi:hypothetical protein